MAEHVTKWLGAFHDGELGAAAAKRIEAHLAECPSCRAELDEIRRLSDLLRQTGPEASFLPADRFADNLALRLPRRTGPEAGHEPRTNGRIAWWIVPIGLLTILLFINVTNTLGSVFSLAAGSGIFGGSLGWLQGTGVQMSWFSSAMELLGGRLGSPGWTVLSALNDANVFIAQLARPLILQGLVGMAYLGWLMATLINSQTSQKIRE